MSLSERLDAARLNVDPSEGNYSRPRTVQRRVSEEPVVQPVDALASVKARAISALFESIGGRISDATLTEEQLQEFVREELARIVSAEQLLLSADERQRLIQDIEDDALGLGPLQRLLQDSTVTEIMVNGHDSIFVERGGRLVETGMAFGSEEHLRRVIERIVANVGRRIDESSPLVDARLSDGSRVNAVIPPLAVHGSSLTIRKFSETPFKVADLVRFGAFTEPMAELLNACVLSRLNIIVSGGTQAGELQGYNGEVSLSNTARRCAIYARISVSTEESVSIERQLEAANQYAAARGWQVLATFVDDGVSASKNKPEGRDGWRSLLDSPEKFDSVIIWKVDRLARSTLDFLHADEALQSRGAGLVAVEDPIDMTTPQGRAFATMLAVFAELEAKFIAARVAGSRRKLIKNGRVVGGKVPYGWRSIDNPDGPGKVLAKNPETIDYVAGMVAQVSQGATVYSVMQWLDEVGAPTPTGRGSEWAYSTVERVLRHPVLAGMTPFNPGNGEKTRGVEVLRDPETGLPVVDESIAILPVGEWRALVKTLDERDSAQAAPRALKSQTSALLSGLLWCGKHDEPVRMHRGTIQDRPAYKCPDCFQTVSNFEDLVVEEFLAAKGEHVRWRRVEVVHEGGAALLPEIEQRLDELDDLIRTAADRAERARLQVEQANLLDLRDEKRAETPRVEYRWEGTDRTFAEDWATAVEVQDRRAVLDDALASITVSSGGVGRRTREQLLARLAFDWKDPERVGPVPTPDEAWV